MLADLPSVDGAAQNKVAARQSQFTKPPGSLGKLEYIAIRMAGWQRTEQPAIRHGQVLYLLAIMVLGAIGIAISGRGDNTNGG